MRLTVFLWLFAVLLAGCMTPVDEAQELAQWQVEFRRLSLDVSARFDEMDSKPGLIVDDGFRADTLDRLADAKIAAQWLSLHEPELQADYSKAAAGYGFAIRSLEQYEVVGLSVARKMFEDAHTRLR